MNSLKSPELIVALQRSISSERLAKYLDEAQGDVSTALVFYERNCRLSESFYTPLQCFEVCLRNALHTQLSGYYGVNWFRNGGPPLALLAKEDIAKALKELEGEGGKVTALPGAVVAELKLGFWVSLLNRRYDTSLWRQCLHLAFLPAARSRGRQPIHQRINVLRRFRNRVAHHEPIFHLDLDRMHREIIETIGWMCPDTSRWAASLSRFEEVSGLAATASSTASELPFSRSPTAS